MDSNSDIALSPGALVTYVVRVRVRVSEREASRREAQRKRDRQRERRIFELYLASQKSNMSRTPQPRIMLVF